MAVLMGPAFCFVTLSKECHEEISGAFCSVRGISPAATGDACRLIIRNIILLHANRNTLDVDLGACSVRLLSLYSLVGFIQSFEMIRLKLLIWDAIADRRDQSIARASHLC